MKTKRLTRRIRKADRRWERLNPRAPWGAPSRGGPRNDPIEEKRFRRELRAHGSSWAEYCDEMTEQYYDDQRAIYGY